MFFFDTDVKIILNCNFLYSNVKNLRSFGKSTFGWRGLVIHGLGNSIKILNSKTIVAL